MSQIVVELLIVSALILANGALAMAELAVVSSRLLRLKARAARGDRRAQVALELAQDPNRFLSTVQVGMTLIATMAGVYGGLTLADHLIRWLKGFPWLAAYGEALGMIVVVSGITYATLVFGELVPKRIAMSNPERIASAVARPLRWLSTLELPLVRLLSGSTGAVLWLLRIKPSSAPSATEEEIKVLLQEGTESGIFEPAEQEIVKRAFRLGDRRAGSLVTRAGDVVWLDASDSPGEIRRKITESPHSCFPVCEGRLDNILGIVHVRDLLVKGYQAEPFNLRGVVKVPLLIYEGTKALRVLELFRSSSTPMGIVLSEHGSVVGVLTITDLLKSLVGEWPVESAPLESQALQQADGSWLIDGLLPIEDFREIFPLARSNDEDYETVAGLILARARRIPIQGDRFEWEGLRFEILGMDGNRIDKILVTPLVMNGTGLGSGEGEGRPAG